MRKRENLHKTKWYGGPNHVTNSKHNYSKWGKNEKALSSYPSLPQKINKQKTKPKKQKKKTNPKTNIVIHTDDGRKMEAQKWVFIVGNVANCIPFVSKELFLPCTSWEDGD